MAALGFHLVRVVEVPDDALVIRFSPFTADRVLARAETAYRRRGEWTSSVFVGLKQEHESDEDLRARLFAAAELHNIGSNNNQKYDVCARAGDLLALGFVFLKDGDEDEAAEHYSVRLGDSPTHEDVTRFLGAFTIRERRPR